MGKTWALSFLMYVLGAKFFFFFFKNFKLSEGIMFFEMVTFFFFKIPCITGKKN